MLVKVTMDRIENSSIYYFKICVLFISNGLLYNYLRSSESRTLNKLAHGTMLLYASSLEAAFPPTNYKV